MAQEKIFADLREELVGLHRVLGPAEAPGRLPAAETADRVRARLRDLLGRAWSPRWRKAADRKPRPRRPKARQSGAHTSVHKILRQAKRQPTTPLPRRNQ